MLKSILKRLRKDSDTLKSIIFSIWMTAKKILAVIRKSLEFELDITGEVVNPFGYARQYIKPLGEQKKGAFFFTHDNESDYWWQGENARLASLAAAFG